ncbi:MAG TPA: ABC transporter ATP-binding protein [Gemmatimonadaceae bacterium]|nr:ABC transporter ATP-binding protein [Gemmatimonadaceae bacterium]
MTAPPAVWLDGLTKRFRTRRSLAAALRRPFATGAPVAALRDVSLAVAQGELFGVLGPNGAGKSTLFKVLATLVLPDAGRAEVMGLDVAADADDVRRMVATVWADERSLYWRLSARENLRLFGVLHGLRGVEAARQADEALAVVGLADTGARLAGQLSTGMRQRLLIARALLAAPRVLLLDEPTRSLDPVTARDLRRFVREELVARRGCTVLLATHNADEAFELCDRVGVLHRGRLLATAPASRLAAALGDDQWAFHTTEPGHRLWQVIAGAPNAVHVAPAAEGGGWHTIRLPLVGGPAAAAEAVARLAAEGVAVGGVERLRLPLAELLERVAAGSGGDA